MADPAATAKAETTHDGTPSGGIGGGSPTVEICGSAACRAGIDFATCAQHLSTPITQGKEGVEINTYPAAAEGGCAHCGCIINATQTTVVIGSATTLFLECNCEPPDDGNYPWEDSTFAYIELIAPLICARTKDGMLALGTVGAIADEFNRRDFIDVILDKRWSEMDAEEIDLRLSTESLFSADRFYVNTGPANIRIHTALKMFYANPDEFKDVSLFENVNVASERGVVAQALADYLLTNEGTVHVGFLYIKEAQADLERRGVAFDDTRSDADKAGILGSYFRQGGKYGDKFQGFLAEDPGHTIRAGEGCSICLQYHRILDALARGNCTPNR